jgi:phosphatidate cytidylyltransferase
VNMSDDDDELDFEGIRIVGGDADDHGLPHWTEPGTGQVPKLSADPDEDLADWASLSAGPRWADDPEVPPVEAPARRVAPVQIGGGGGAGAGGAVEDDFFTYEDAPRRAAEPQRRSAAPRRGVAERGIGKPDASSSDLGARLITGLALAAVAVVALLLGKEATLLVIAAVLALAASEFYVSLQKVGYQPATLLGLTAVLMLPLAAYWRGEAAFGVVLFLSVVFGALWFLLGVGTERPVPNLGVTLLGVCYVGVLGSFAALLLDTADGKGLLLTAILLGAGYDIGGYFIGRQIGRSPLTETSPNKTVEGLFGGMLTTVAVAIVIPVIGVGPFGDELGVIDTVLVGVAAAVMAPIGDLAESLMKRDLGLKDMGSILPGHGGLLDRFDALLFVLPTVYYMVRLLS